VDARLLIVTGLLLAGASLWQMTFFTTEIGAGAIVSSGVLQGLGLGLIFAITLPDNLASQAVMKRIGLTYRRQVTYRGFNVVWFDRSRD